jgi:hypothetical protein
LLLNRGTGGRYAFDNRGVIERRPVRRLMAAAAEQLAGGRIGLGAEEVPGYRWLDQKPLRL